MNKATNPVIEMGIQSRIELAQTIKEAEQRLAMAQETIKQAKEAIASLDSYFGEEEAYREVSDIFAGGPEEFFNYVRSQVVNLLGSLIQYHEDNACVGVMAENWKSSKSQLEEMVYSEEEFEKRLTWQGLTGLINNLRAFEGVDNQEALGVMALRCMQMGSVVPQSFYAGATDFSRGNLNPMNNRMTRMMGGRNPNGPMMPGSGDFGPMHSNYNPYNNSRF